MNRNLAKLAVPVGVVGIILLLVVPVPAELLDFLLIISIMLALVTLLTAMFVKKPLDFSVFPSLLLVTTTNWMTTRIRKMTAPMMIEPPTAT